MSNETEINALLDKTDLEHMLEFETQLFLDIIHKDGLVVAAKGLNLDLVISNLIKVYCDPGNLVIVLNFTELEHKFYNDKINDSNIYKIDSTKLGPERSDLYLSGGVHFVTTRILVVDMLKKRIPIEKITGIIVLRAHSIFESCQEAFLLRLLRQNNKTGFIKAFTNSALSFTVGFNQVERVMRALFVKELYIWPRFHSLVIDSLRIHEPQVIELHIPITNNMQKMQAYILELMNLTVKELKRINKSIELQEITVENCLTKKFHKILQAQLDVIWHQLSSKSLQLVNDLKTLRHLIVMMLYSDPVTFYSILSGYRTMQYAQSSSWVLYQPAELLFSQASSLVYSGDKEFNPELCPKWEALLEILRVEVPHEIKRSKLKEAVILILCSDHRTCSQLNQLLTNGPHHYLFMNAIKKGVTFKSVSDKFKKFKIPDIAKPQKVEKAKEKPSTSKRAKKGNNKTDDEDNKESSTKEKENKEDEDEEFKDSYLLTMSQTVLEDNDETVCPDNNKVNDSAFIFEPFTQMENIDLTQICEAALAPTILIQTFKARSHINLQRLMHDLKPTFVIMYHSDITAIREIEMYEAHSKNNSRLKVFFLMHNGTVEEQSYLTTLRREKEAFEFLIETKSTMVVPEDQDGKSDQCLALQRDMNTPTKNTRQGGKPDEAFKKQVILVDMREFRSELPALIHKRGIEIEPVTITVGDYILTTEICVERKSISDLIGSLNSGRLHQQCTQMTRYYSKPMLLIEFDQTKPFSWQNHYMMSTDTDKFEVQQNLLLLTLHFPKLKIIWSPSPYASAQLFEELKQGKEEPNIEYAMAIGSEEDMDTIESKYNATIYDFVRKLPGITSKNIDNFLRKVKNMDAAVKLSEEELKEVLGNSVDARAFYSILHEQQAPKDEIDPSKQKGKGKPRFMKYSKKK